MIEDELRESFARHESMVPEVAAVRTAVDGLAVRRRRRRFALRAAGTALAVLATVSAPVLIHSVGSAPDRSPVPGELVGAPSGRALPDRALDFLVLGVDGEGTDTGNRADTVLVVHVPRDRSHLYLVSLPRDLGVEIPGYGFDKLDTAFFYGSRRPGAAPDLPAGGELTEKTVSGMSGLHFDGTATVTFTALRELTDAVGGLRLCLDQPVKSVHTERTFPAGCQHLDGAESLDLLRQRRWLHGGGHDRDRNGQRFVKALLAKLASEGTLTDPRRLMAIMKIVGAGLLLDTGDLPLADLIGAGRDVGAAEPVGVGWEFNSQVVGGKLYERLDPVLSRGLFDAMRGDTLDQWVAANPEHVTRDAG